MRVAENTGDCIACGKNEFSPYQTIDKNQKNELIVCSCGLARLEKLPGNSVITGYYQDDFYAYLTGSRFTGMNVVTFYHVLEHLPNPEEYLSEAWRILKDRGMLIIEVPNFDSLTSRLFRKYWFGLDIPRHIYHFTPRSLSKLLQKHGFDIEKISHFSLEYSLFVVLQTFLDFFFKNRSALFNFMKNTEKTYRDIAKAVSSLLFASISFIPAFIFTALTVIIKKGDIMTFYCRKKHMG